MAYPCVSKGGRQVGRKSGIAFSGTIALAVLAAVGSEIASARAAAPDPESGAGLAGWTSLTLTASKAMIFSASSTLGVADGTDSESGRPAVVFTTRSRATLLGAVAFEEQTTSHIDRGTMRPVELLQIRPGESARRFRFLAGSAGLVRQTSWEPPPDKPSIPFEQWRQVETEDRRFTYSDGSGPASGEWLTDFYSLIYLLSDIDLDEAAAGPREFTTIYRRHLVRIRVVPGERRQGERKARNEETGQDETLRLRERRIKLKPLGDDAGSFRGLMGMQGESEIWLDEQSGALLELNGRAAGFGETQVLLASFRRSAGGSTPLPPSP
ncbi:MAG TPA: hypothetical protein VFP98_09120 [Candidatus Polarisedimenticolia bacterium]|nr:hypothetical protein [Candidatus Polarisedimenticolia bacterium]